MRDKKVVTVYEAAPVRDYQHHMRGITEREQDSPSPRMNAVKTSKDCRNIMLISMDVP